MARMTPEQVASLVEVIGQKQEDFVRTFTEFRADLLGAITMLGKAVQEANARADRMADRLIQMAMVNRGAFREAVAGQRVNAALDTAKAPFQNTDDWGQPFQAEEEWPPKGHVAMNIP